MFWEEEIITVGRNKNVIGTITERNYSYKVRLTKIWQLHAIKFTIRSTNRPELENVGWFEIMPFAFIDVGLFFELKCYFLICILKDKSINAPYKLQKQYKNIIMEINTDSQSNI